MRKFKIAVYNEEKSFLSALAMLKENNIEVYDAFTPYPMHEVFHHLGRKSRLPAAAYLLGLLAILGILGFQFYTSVHDWPIVYGGKPFNSFPSFIVVTIVLTIFTITIGSLAIFSVRAGLLPGSGNTIFDERATDDKFIIVLSHDSLDPQKLNDAESILKERGSVEIIEKEFEKVNG